jgi:hypothetical protein
MANVQFGAKEVMDVTLYDMTTNLPVIQFDSLKTSSISVTSEKIYARGGKGNPKLITWETNKEATLTIEDALISPKSLELVSGVARATGAHKVYMRQATQYTTDTPPVDKGKRYPLTTSQTGEVTLAFTPNEAVGNIIAYEADDDCGTRIAMTDATLVGKVLTLPATLSKAVVVYFSYQSAATTEAYIIDVEHFSGTYKLVGDTVLRNQSTGKDEAFQVVIPNLKFTSNLELGFTAEGDPTTTTFECEIMQDSSTGTMIEMIKY